MINKNNMTEQEQQKIKKIIEDKGYKVIFGKSGTRVIETYISTIDGEEIEITAMSSTKINDYKFLAGEAGNPYLKSK